MNQDLTESSVECLAHATEAQQRADEATDPETKREFANMARMWRHLAEGYQFVERVDDFLNKPKSMLRH